MIGMASSRAPSIAACVPLLPISKWRWTFSTTMMASSTTRPMAKTIASKVKRLIEKPKRSMRKPAPTIDRGTATDGTKAARIEPSDRKMTSSTISTASASVLKTSLMDSSMNSLAS